ncbi:MAG: amino acid carrier protein, partial [Rickettsiales bacterium]
MDYINYIFKILQIIEQFYWQYIGIIIIIFCGIFFTFKAKFLQFKALPNIINFFKSIYKEGLQNNRGINPIKLIFASTGGMIGVGNVVGVGSAILIGGPGAFLWLWVGVIFGSLIKYCEIYLSISTRVSNKIQSYDGGLMFYIIEAFNIKFLAKVAAVLLCIYSIEIYQFTVIVDTINTVCPSVEKYIIVLGLLLLILYSSSGGIKRISAICSIIMPIFLSLYIIIGSWIIFINTNSFFVLFKEIFYSALNGQSAIGGFVGSSILLTAYNGIARSVYAGDIGIGYDSIVHSESSAKDPKQQGILAIYCLLLNAIICSVSMLMIIVTQTWQSTFTYHSEAIPNIFNEYLWCGQYFMAFILFFAGFTTVISFLTIGIKSFNYLFNSNNTNIYLWIASIILVIFAYVPQEKVMLIMSICSGMLLLINISAIIKLRDRIK